MINFVTKSILACTLFVSIPDFFISSLILLDDIFSADKGGQYSRISLMVIILFIKLTMIKYIINLLKQHFKNKVIIKLNIPYINYVLIPALIFYYWVLFSGHATESEYYNYTGIISVTMFAIQVGIYMKFLAITKIKSGNELDVDDAKKALDFNGFVEIIVDMDLGKVTYKMGDMKISEDKFYYKDFVFNVTQLFKYLKEFDMSIEKMSDDELTVAKMYCI